MLRKVGKGDRSAFDELYHRNAGWLTLRLGRRCRDPELVAEVLQDTFVTVWRSAKGFSRKGSATGWLWTVATSRLVDTYRRRGARIQATAALSEDAVVTRSAEAELLAASFSTEMAGALDQLSPELRAVLQATVLDGMNTRETSVLLGIPEGTVKARAHRARKYLREALA